jgi:hypothetical protein
MPVIHDRFGHAIRVPEWPSRKGLEILRRHYAKHHPKAFRRSIAKAVRTKRAEGILNPRSSGKARRPRRVQTSAKRRTPRKRNPGGSLAFVLGWLYGRRTGKELSAREIAQRFPRLGAGEEQSFAQGMLDGIKKDTWRLEAVSLLLY